MTGDCHVRFGERLAGKFRWPTQLAGTRRLIAAALRAGGGHGV